MLWPSPSLALVVAVSSVVVLVIVLSITVLYLVVQAAVHSGVAQALAEHRAHLARRAAAPNVLPHSSTPAPTPVKDDRPLNAQAS